MDEHRALELEFFELSKAGNKFPGTSSDRARLAAGTVSCATNLLIRQLPGSRASAKCIDPARLQMSRRMTSVRTVTIGDR